MFRFHLYLKASLVIKYMVDFILKIELNLIEKKLCRKHGHPDQATAL